MSLYRDERLDESPAEEERPLANVQRTVKRQAILLGGIVVFLWLLEFVDWLLLNGRLDAYGIIPRTAVGARGILLAPFLHGGFDHVAANTFPFLVLGWLVLLSGPGTFLAVSVIVALVSGFGTWAIGGAQTVHIGASGLIFGYLSYLLFRSYYQRSLINIIITLLVAVIYGGLIWGVLPQGNAISWEGHLFGFIGGGVAAYLLGTPRLGKPHVNADRIE